MNYWDEAVRAAFDEAEITATEEQILQVVDFMEGAHENEFMCHAPVENPLIHEISELKRKHENETKDAEKRLDATKALALRARGLSPDDACVTYSYGESHFELRR